MLQTPPPAKPIIEHVVVASETDRFNAMLGRLEESLRDPANPVYAGEFVPLGVGVHGDRATIRVSIQMKPPEPPSKM